MSDQIAKKDLQEIATGIIDAVDLRLKQTEQQFDTQLKYAVQLSDSRFSKIEERMDLFDKKLDKLMTALDNFLKQLSDYKDEFIILRSQVDRIKQVLKEKLGVDLSR